MIYDVFDAVDEVCCKYVHEDGRAVLADVIHAT